jgi:plasmid stabilization system protein ParE
LAWGRSARRDVDQIASHYGRFGAELPELLRRRIEVAPLPLLDNPEIGSPTRRERVRRWPVRRTPFILLYTVVSGEVRIQRVVDARSTWA